MLTASMQEEQSYTDIPVTYTSGTLPDKIVKSNDVHEGQWLKVKPRPQDISVLVMHNCGASRASLLIRVL